MKAKNVALLYDLWEKNRREIRVVSGVYADILQKQQTDEQKKDRQ